MQSASGIYPLAEPVADGSLGLKTVYLLNENPTVRRDTFVFLSERNFAPRSFTAGQDFLDSLEHLEPGCLLLGELSATSGTRRLIEALGPRMVEFPFVVSASHGDVNLAVEAMKLGASDVLELPFGRDVLPVMLESILSRLDERLSRVRSVHKARSLVQSLTAREGEVLRHLLRGATNLDVARDLGLSLRTVEMHRASMMVRLGVKSLVDAFRVAIQAGAMGSGPDWQPDSWSRSLAQ